MRAAPRPLRTPVAIVVLGCWIDPDGVPGPAAARRADAGLRAWRAGLAPRIITSGGRRWPARAQVDPPISEASALARWLVARGVPEGAIYRELASMNTAENAIYTRSLVARIAGPAERDAGARVFVATCSWHLPRALEAFRRAGLDPSGLPADGGTSTLGRAAAVVHEIVSARLDRGRAAMRSFHGADHLDGDEP